MASHSSYHPPLEQSIQERPSPMISTSNTHSNAFQYPTTSANNMYQYPTIQPKSSLFVDSSREGTSPLMHHDSPFHKLKGWLYWIGRRYQSIIDMSHPYTVYRWIFTISLIVLFMLRILTYQGFYVIAYSLGIYLLSQFLAFLTPKFGPQIEDMDNEADLHDLGPALPTNADDEFKPFVRRLPEFVFWYTTTKSIMIGMICTLFSILDIPVFWPILLIYFILLVIFTLRKQIMHMIKYNYLPWDAGKPKYSGLSR